MSTDTYIVSTRAVLGGGRPAALLRPLLALLIVLLACAVFLAPRSVVAGYMEAQSATILASAQRHGLPPEVLAAVFYNETLGQEYRFVDSLIPGDGNAAQMVQDALLGWHFLTLKQAQWAGKALLALAGVDTTVGPTGIRVSVGREIRDEVGVYGGRYRPGGLSERPLMILDLMFAPTAIEYLAANLERGVQRSGSQGVGDWLVCARWHNTGLVADRPDVPRPVWEKGSRYVARVKQFLPPMTAMLDRAGEADGQDVDAYGDTRPAPLIGLGVRRVQTAAVLAGMLGLGVP